MVILGFYVVYKIDETFPSNQVELFITHRLMQERIL